MTRLKGLKRERISNRMAVIAALLLMVTALTGVFADVHDGIQTSAHAESAEAESKNKLNVRLVLFRHG